MKNNHLCLFFEQEMFFGEMMGETGLLCDHAEINAGFVELFI